MECFICCPDKGTVFAFVDNDNGHLVKARAKWIARYLRRMYKKKYVVVF